uniref:Uncharacterized protein n=1 Tax=Mycena chlorophos TaxID=658473 RepID=A0ABQ0LJ89_MYCCL|nr:predicted protein [Mycena chlorophos]
MPNTTRNSWRSTSGAGGQLLGWTKDDTEPLARAGERAGYARVCDGVPGDVRVHALRRACAPAIDHASPMLREHRTQYPGQASAPFFPSASGFPGPGPTIRCRVSRTQRRRAGSRGPRTTHSRPSPRCSRRQDRLVVKTWLAPRTLPIPFRSHSPRTQLSSALLHTRSARCVGAASGSRLSLPSNPLPTRPRPQGMCPARPKDVGQPHTPSQHRAPHPRPPAVSAQPGLVVTRAGLAVGFDGYAVRTFHRARTHIIPKSTHAVVTHSSAGLLPFFPLFAGCICGRHSLATRHSSHPRVLLDAAHLGGGRAIETAAYHRIVSLACTEHLPYAPTPFSSPPVDGQRTLTLQKVVSRHVSHAATFLSTPCLRLEPHDLESLAPLASNMNASLRQTSSPISSPSLDGSAFALSVHFGLRMLAGAGSSRVTAVSLFGPSERSRRRHEARVPARWAKTSSTHLSLRSPALRHVFAYADTPRPRPDGPRFIGACRHAASGLVVPASGALRRTCFSPATSAPAAFHRRRELFRRRPDGLHLPTRRRFHRCLSPSDDENQPWPPPSSMPRSSILIRMRRHVRHRPDGADLPTPTPTVFAFADWVGTSRPAASRGSLFLAHSLVCPARQSLRERHQLLIPPTTRVSSSTSFLKRDRIVLGLPGTDAWYPHCDTHCRISTESLDAFDVGVGGGGRKTLPAMLRSSGAYTAAFLSHLLSHSHFLSNALSSSLPT